ncbi:UDP-glycosyltransferase 74F2-like [Mangifera indica]|uniref:UDP-glycosyltransferase 74F2-like n=1 Tax=Mangifera indica TaxID=29780 RepID=UPI001CFBF195|nr:UDP-glycosyltransferase 74F2-like [Mangifera indica]
MEEKIYRAAHVLVIPYPRQGHINPALQLAKRLASKGLKTTIAITKFIFKTIQPQPPSSLQFETISDGFDERGRFAEAVSVHDYLQKMEAAGSKTLAELITKYKNSSNPIDCIVYDTFLPWALEVAKQFGLLGAAFFTQTCAVNYIYYLVYNGLLKVPVSSTAAPVSITGLPLLEPQDLPSFVYVAGEYPDYFEMLLGQFSNTDKADFLLVNTFYELEDEVVNTMHKICPALLTVGPTIPSFYLDNRIENDKDYDLDLLKTDKTICIDWLNARPKGSVVYVSFGSISSLSHKQMEELAWGLKQTDFHFLWVVRDSEDLKLPKGFIEETTNKGLIVKWSPQLAVLSNEALGCFFSHAGWNSTIEALSLAVPMVVMPLWTDQPTDAKLVQDVWKVGIRVVVEENGIVTRDEIEKCVRKVIVGEKAREMKLNAEKWRKLAIEAVSEGGSSDKNIDEFVSKLGTTSYKYY